MAIFLGVYFMTFGVHLSYNIRLSQMFLRSCDSRTGLIFQLKTVAILNLQYTQNPRRDSSGF